MGHPCVNFAYGEVEDYSVNIGGGNACAGNQNPQVALTSNAGSYSTGASIILNAHAADNDGTVTKVEFYSNGTRMTEDASSPFTYTMTNAQSGTYTFQATATDNCGGTAVSTLQVSVNGGVDPCAGNSAPSVSVTSDKASYTTGQVIQLNATATDPQGVARVEFYLGTLKLGETAAQPYRFNYTSTATGAFTFTARAIDLCGAHRDASVNRNVVNPTNTCGDGIQNGGETGVDCGGACGPCQELEYCPAQGKTKYEYVGQVIFGAINHTSGDNGGYGDYTNFNTSVTAGQVYSITLVPVYNKDAYNEGWAVWIDANQDGDFDDSGEKVLSSLVKDKLVANVTIPAHAKNGVTRMRIIMQYKALPGSPCTGPNWA